MKITWFGHSCFKIDSQDASLVIDPYAPNSVPGLKPLHLQADLVLNSHRHDDHYCPQAVTVRMEHPGVFSISHLDTYHDDVQGAARGTDRIHIISAEGLRLAHLGDLGCDLTADQAQALTGLDVLMVPVGGHFTIDGDQAFRIAERLKPRSVIPMHYRGEGFGYEVITTVDRFLSHFPEAERLDTNVVEVTDRQPVGVIVPAMPR